MKKMQLFLVWACLLLGATACMYFGGSEVQLPVWEAQSLEHSSSIRGLSAVDEQVAWLSGSGNTIARTSDGGRRWQRLPAPSGRDTLDFRDIEAFDSLHAVVMSAGPGRRSRVYRTEDGGQTWELALENTDSSGFFNGMAFWDSRSGILTGDPVGGVLYLALTTDGGRSWRRIPAEALPVVSSEEYGFAASGSHIAVAGDSAVWIGTGGSKARVFYSGNRGRSWTVSNTPMISGRPSAGIFSLVFWNEKEGVAVGGDYVRDTLVANNVMYSADGGKSWHLVENHSLSYRSCIRSVENMLIAAGPRGSDLSLDGGRTWQRIDTAGYHVIGAGPRPGAIWAAGSGGRVARLIWK